MQTTTPYLEGDSYYMNESSKTTDNETNLNSVKVESVDQVDVLTEQLQKTEEEINTLRQVLNVKLKLAQDLKRQLGITVINEMKEDIIHSINSIKESNTYKATTVVMKNVKEKTTNTISTASTKFQQKIGLLKNTNTFKSIEGKMGTAYTTVKKVPCKYNPGDKIFAKVKGFVYWPARVNPLPPDIVIPPNKIPIFFYGTHEVYFISPTSCWPYDEKNKSKWGKPKPRAYFNQGMDEIENSSTIYQYGTDPVAESFLSQFYQFKTSDGQDTTPKFLNTFQNNDDNTKSTAESDEITNNEEVLSNKAPNKKRNKSGSSLNIKQNKNNTKLNNSKSSETRKRHISDSTSDIKNSEQLPTENTTDVTIRKRKKSGTSESEHDSILTKSVKPRTVSRKRGSLCVEKPDYKKDTVVKNADDKDIKLELEMPSILNLEQNIDSIEEDKDLLTNNLKYPSVKFENEVDDIAVIADSIKDFPKLENLKFSDEVDYKPATRCRTQSSSNTKLSVNQSEKSSDDKISEIESDSLSVDSDNPADEDFRPAIQTKRLTKKQKNPKATKVPAKKVNAKIPKKNFMKPKSKNNLKKKVNLKDNSSDSLSSISSDEDWKAKDEKQKKELEEKLKSIQLQQLEMEEIAVKEASKKTKAKRLSDSLLIEKDKCDNIEVDQKENVELNNDGIIEKNLKIDKEIIINIYKNDIISEDAENNLIEVDVLEKPNASIFQQDTIDNEKKQDLKIPEIGCSIVEETAKNYQNNKDSKILLSTDDDDLIVIGEQYNLKLNEPEELIKDNDLICVEEIKKIKINIKEMKTVPGKAIKKKSSKPTGRKRSRKISSSISSSSDVEIKKVDEFKPKSKRTKLIDRNSSSDDNKIELKVPDKFYSDKIQTLQNFNVDIRSSLVLGKEDYKTCVERFKSLCEMSIDLVTLVNVWQLMDTVKKCRRYKRNEEIKQEAQAVYKRFMGIYSRASKDEINLAQSLLMQYRHQNNIQNQNVGVESNKSNGSLSHGVAIPISVAEMFQNKLPNQSDSSKTRTVENKDSGSRTSKEFALSNNDVLGAPKQTNPTLTEEEINKEKMRLLSVDLEAKVSDILNKIEKNVDTNPINQKSLSHLLPSTDTNSTINLPTHWKTVNDKQTIVDKEKNVGDEMTDDDDEDDDVETIVRRIEEVEIKVTEVEPPSDVLHNKNGSNVGGILNSSALDARIENLINNSFIPTKETRPKKSRMSSASRHHTNTKNSSPYRTSNLKTDTIGDASTPVISATTVPIASVIASHSSETHESKQYMSEPQEQKDDIEIYDLLGV